MADPLSITASIIAIISAAEGVTLALSRIKTIYDAQAEVLAFINELSDLGVVFSNVEKYIVHRIQEPETQVPQEQMQSIATLVESATIILHEVDQLVHSRLILPRSTRDQTAISRYGWLRLKPDLQRHRKRLKSIRLNVLTQMVTINS